MSCVFPARMPLTPYRENGDDVNETACQFEAFKCSSFEEWQGGNCFSCPDDPMSDDSCVRPGLRLFDRLATPSQLIRRSYYFNTRPDGGKVGAFCGKFDEIICTQMYPASHRYLVWDGTNPLTYQFHSAVFFCVSSNNLILYEFYFFTTAPPQCFCKMSN